VTENPLPPLGGGCHEVTGEGKKLSPIKEVVTLNLIQGLFDAIEQNETIAKFRKLLRNCNN
jgi:hypothetical protein